MYKRQESGTILILVIVFALASLMIGLTVLSLPLYERKLVNIQEAKACAFYGAEAGLEILHFRLSDGQSPILIIYDKIDNTQVRVDVDYSTLTAISEATTSLKGSEATKFIKVSLEFEAGEFICFGNWQEIRP